MQEIPNIKAETFHVDELVSRVLRGRIRVPRFQRGLKWKAGDVQKLFDSINLGYPIGTFLMWKRPAPAEELAFGPVQVQGVETDDAWWVVDGQQRLTSLVAGLKHPDPGDPDDPFVVYYDMKPKESQPAFFRPHRLRRATPFCIPLARCFDATDFQQWLFDFVEETSARGLIEHASGVATRIRNYRVPVYVVETKSEEIARQIFLRTNRAGRRMDMHEVFAALSPATEGADYRPEKIAHRISAAFGPLDPNVVAKAAKSLVSDDVTRVDSQPEVEHHEEWMRKTEDGLVAALRFVNECRVPHIRLLPAVPTPLITLSRFFSRHPSPSDRNRRLLRRWLWRGFFGESLGSDAKTLRRAVVAVGDSEDTSVQSLLSQVPRRCSYQLPKDFDARNGSARLVALVMALQMPASSSPNQLDLLQPTGDEGSDDVFEWLQRHGADVFTQLPNTESSPPSRFITPGATSAQLRDQLMDWACDDINHPALKSHLVSKEAALAFKDGNTPLFLSLRSEQIVEAANSLHASMAEPQHSDRPSLRGVEP